MGGKTRPIWHFLTTATTRGILIARYQSDVILHEKQAMKIPLILLSCVLSAWLSAQPLQLFNGKDLTGWKVYGTEKWFVSAGELICESGPEKGYGYLATERTFKDFHLSVDFFQESNGNSGVFFHAEIEGTRIAGWQAEVAPAGLHTGGIYESYGRGWLIKPDASKETVLKQNEWNTLVVEVVGNQVTTWLNGVQMITLADHQIGSRSGKIALQIHDGGGVRVRWRNLVLIER